MHHALNNILTNAMNSGHRVEVVLANGDNVVAAWDWPSRVKLFRHKAGT